MVTQYRYDLMTFQMLDKGKIFVIGHRALHGFLISKLNYSSEWPRTYCNISIMFYCQVCVYIGIIHIVFAREHKARLLLALSDIGYLQQSFVNFYFIMFLVLMSFQLTIYGCCKSLDGMASYLNHYMCENPQCSIITWLSFYCGLRFLWALTNTIPAISRWRIALFFKMCWSMER